MTNLGLTLRWEQHYRDDSSPAPEMSSSIVKGMPYATMVYEDFDDVNGKRGSSSLSSLLPTIASEIELERNPIADSDGRKELICSSTSSPPDGRASNKPLRVERELEMEFGASDYTWLVFFSEPVRVQCVVTEKGGVQIQVVERSDDDEPLVIRAALYKTCSSGRSPTDCHQERMHPTALLAGQGDFGTVLRQRAHLFPGPDTRFDYSVDDGARTIHMSFDWDVQRTKYTYNHSSTLSPSDGSGSTATAEEQKEPELLTYALPHHADLLLGGITYFKGDEQYCTASLVGPACLVEGFTWNMVEKVPDIDFRAPRPPGPWSIKNLSESLKRDLKFTLPSYYQRGAGDTYFSGKQLAKLARILLIAEELDELCSSSGKRAQQRYSTNDTREDAWKDYEEACRDSDVPSGSDISEAAKSLRESVEVWLNGKAETPFVFDSSCKFGSCIVIILRSLSFLTPLPFFRCTRGRCC